MFAFTNATTNRSYVAEYVIAAGEAMIDTLKSVVIPGDTNGAWAIDNGAGLYVRWGLMTGTTFQQAAGAWGTVNAVGSPNQYNFFGTAGNVFELFDVGLYEGNVAPPFAVPDFISELALCKRYWELTPVYGAAYSTAGSAVAAVPAYYNVEKRAVPTVFGFASGGTFSNCTVNSLGVPSTKYGQVVLNVTATGAFVVAGFLNVSARL